MKISLVNSLSDPAGRNARAHLEAQLMDGWKERLEERGIFCGFRELPERLIHAEGIDRGMDADLIVFLSRHTSSTPLPMLTTHAPGNFATAELGGSPYQFPPASPRLMRAVLRQLEQHAPGGYIATYEATHHGPTDIETPCFFLEIGSTEREWRDPDAGQAIATSLLHALDEGGSDAIPLLGLGGDHYATRATRIALSTRGAFGHIVPAREVPLLEEEHLAALMNRGGAEAVYIDHHSLAPALVRRLRHYFESIGVPLLGERELRAIGGLGLRTYLLIKRIVAEIHPGARVVACRLEGEGEPVQFSIPSELLEEAEKAGRSKILQALEAFPVCYLTDEGGRLIPCFFTFEKWRAQLINALIRLCIQTISGYRETSIDGDCLIILESRFDPEKARMLGVPAGPLYKRLSLGEAVEVNGERITPEMVQTRSRKVLHIPELERYG